MIETWFDRPSEMWISEACGFRVEDPDPEEVEKKLQKKILLARKRKLDKVIRSCRRGKRVKTRR